ncbi:hypothetical protein ACIQWZ_03605 [Streptomyces sp. NPDC098077]|uniref:hypothetical protein n=1 Tax=unclassified Streptomyces TaxID=2593676 RepID=UPI00380751FD
MKTLLRLILSAALVANVFLGFAVDRNGLEVALSVVSGVVVLASAAGLWALRGSREDRSEV